MIGILLGLVIVVVSVLIWRNIKSQNQEINDIWDGKHTE